MGVWNNSMTHFKETSFADENSTYSSVLEAVKTLFS
jgi:hypothetical protein